MFLFAAVVTGTFSASARAESGGRPVPSSYGGPGIRVVLHGFWVPPLDQDGAIGAAVSGLGLVGPLEVGLSGMTQTSGVFEAGSRSGVMGLLGLRTRRASIEADVALVAGSARIQTPDGGLFSGDKGTSDTLAFAGGQASLSYLFFRSRKRPQCVVGAVLALGYYHDFGSRHVTYTYESEDWLTGAVTTRTRTVRLAVDQFALMVGIMVGTDF